MKLKELSPYLLQHPASSPIKEEVSVRKGPAVEEGFDLGAYWRIIRERLWLVVTVFLASILYTVCTVLQIPPLYTAQSTLLIERKAPQALETRGEVNPEDTSYGGDYDYYKTQYEILRSRSLAARVIHDQGLNRAALFSETEKREAGLIGGIWTKVKALAKARSWGEAGQKAALPESSAEEKSLGTEAKLITPYLKILQVQPVRQTRLVKVSFTTPDPDLSAQLANSHAQAYIRYGLELNKQAKGEAQRFLEEQLVELKERVEKSEVALNRYRRDKGIISLSDKENIIVDRLGDLNKLLTEAEATRIGLEAQVRLIRKRDYYSLPTVIENQSIQALRATLAKLEDDYAQISAEFKPEFPQRIQLKEQVEETRQRLNRSVHQVVAGLASEYLAARTKEKELRTKMEEQKATTLRMKDSAVDYAILEREVNTNRQLYDNVLQRMKEVEMAAELRASNTSIIDRAERPTTSSGPGKTRSMLFNAMMGLLGGIGLAFLLDYVDQRLKTLEDVEQYLGLPNLAAVPDFYRVNQRKSMNQNRLFGKYHAARVRSSKTSNPGPGSDSTAVVLSPGPFSVVTEAYRMLRNAILLSRAGEPPRTVIFTSAVEGEGKTTTTIKTAMAFAQMGIRVLVIDADLRRGRCHTLLGMENHNGLTEFLAGQRDLEEVIQPTAKENLFIISSGVPPPNAAELVGSSKMAEMLQSLQNNYDCIFVDSPPVMPVSDTIPLSTMVDGVVLVVNGPSTSRKVVKEAQTRLNYARAKILGVVLNRMDPQRGTYSYYYQYASSYLTPTAQS
jgi:succinoglycan biosynthesis transport protein ExoP